MKLSSATLAFLLAATTSFAASPGEQLFLSKCKACHQVKGVGGKLGPDLTHVGSKRNEGFILEKLENPKKQNPSSTMPSYRTLPKKDKADLLNYLKSLK